MSQNFFSLDKALYDVENGLNLYASSFFYLPAHLLYEKDSLKTYEHIYRRCHIYMIGYLPKISLLNFRVAGGKAIFEYMFGSKRHDLELPIPSQYELVTDDKGIYAVDRQGKKEEIAIKEKILNKFMQQHSTFDIQYIGQAYGKNGSRNAFDRLLKHETLQKIAIKGAPEGKVLQLLLIEIEASSQLVTILNPFAKQQDPLCNRIKSGIDKLHSTSGSEQTCLYEAALIKYFKPKYNQEFKATFPSNKLKILQKCYESDLLMVSAEIAFDDLPFQLCSDAISAKTAHNAIFHLHNDDERRSFLFSQDEQL